MPDDTLTEAAKEAYASAPSNDPILDTLEVYHPLAGHLYLVADTQDHNLTLEDDTTHLFTACGFQLELPSSGENGMQELRAVIDDTDEAASAFLDLANESVAPITLTYREYLLSDLTTPLMDPPLTLYLKDAVGKNGQVTGRATFTDLINKKFPTEVYTRKRFPSLAN